MFDSKSALSSNISDISSYSILLFSINNAVFLVKELGCNKYKSLCLSLHKYLAKETRAQILWTCYNEFLLVSKHNISIQVENCLNKYMINNEIYLSCSLISKQFTNINTNNLHYQALSDIDFTPRIESIEKIYPLYNAIQNKDLSSVLQPIVNSKHCICFYECLIRETKGLFSSTSRMVETAEEAGMINQIDDYALILAKEIIVNDHKKILSINVSPSSIDNTDWSKTFVRNVEELEIANNLIIEITETGNKRDHRKITKFIDKIKKIGAKIALDDFGSGCTSFSQLKSFQLDFVKIDGSFIKGIAHNQADKIFVKSVIDTAHALNIKAIAECVENKEIFETLNKWQVDYFQGYYFGRPNTTLIC